MLNSIYTCRNLPRLSWLLFCSIVLLSAGCQLSPQFSSLLGIRQPVQMPTYSEPTFSVFVSPQFRATRPKRILLLESGHQKGNYGESKKLIAELASSFRRLGICEVVVSQDVRLRQHSDNILQGKFDEREIAALSRQFNADAIGVVRVNELVAFSPMRVSITLAIIDSNESVVTFAVDGTWDTTRPATNNEFQRYVCGSCNSVLNTSELKSVGLQSPTKLLSFAASQITDSLNSKITNSSQEAFRYSY